MKSHSKIAFSLILFLFLISFSSGALPLLKSPCTSNCNYTTFQTIVNGSSYNITYESFTQLNNQTIWTAINSIVGGNANASWNETRGNQLYIRLNNATINNLINAPTSNASFNNTYTDLAYIKVSNATIGNGIKFWYNQTEGTFQYIDANYTASLNYANNILQGNLSANNSKWSSTFNQTYDSFWLSNGTIWTAINSALAGGNASWNQTWAESLFATFSYVHNIVQGNLSANITKVYENINISNTILYNNLTSYITTNNTATYVPYLGANKGVDLGNNNLTLNSIELNENLNISGYIEYNGTSTPPTTPSGTVRVYAITQNGVTRLEQASDAGFRLVYFRDAVQRVRNNEGSTVEIGDLVYASGSSGTTPDVKLARADAQATSGPIGMVLSSTIGNGAFGTIQFQGIIGGVGSGLDTSGFSAGDTLYLSDTQAGNLTNVPPVSPNLSIQIGTVIVAHANNGQIFLRLQQFSGNLSSIQIPDLSDTYSTRTNSTSTYVPYVGASKLVNLGANNLTTSRSLNAENVTIGSAVYQTWNTTCFNTYSEGVLIQSIGCNA